MPEIKERPIPFTAESVRAILEGYKTQTRRVMREQRYGGGIHQPPHKVEFCPHGDPGQRLWVKENFFQYGGPVEYEADEGMPSFDRKKTFSRFMPKHASRILLELTDVRAERLQDISVADCYAEGIRKSTEDWAVADLAPNPQAAYKCMWERINGKDSWAENPWVWVLEFKRVKP